jgi:hypothetical protein
MKRMGIATIGALVVLSGIAAGADYDLDLRAGNGAWVDLSHNSGTATDTVYDVVDSGEAGTYLVRVSEHYDPDGAGYYLEVLVNGVTEVSVTDVGEADWEITSMVEGETIEANLYPFDESVDEIDSCGQTGVGTRGACALLAPLAIVTLMLRRRAVRAEVRAPGWRRASP